MSDLDEATVIMVQESYVETIQEAIEGGQDKATAHAEGLTAASMFVASLKGVDDAAARSIVEGLGLDPSLVD